MDAHLQRALLLYEQSRYEQAEGELRQALAVEPRDAFAHAVLALCLAKRERYAEASGEAQQSVHMAPDLPFAHYAHASVLHERNCLPEAQAAIAEAIRLDPYDTQFFAELAHLKLDLRQWEEARQAAEQGLAIDPEHVPCTNLRAIALVKLGRRSEAGATIDAALAKNPDNSVTHANQGWTLLESGDTMKALEHFRESLRLDPENEWARQGLIEALKARYFIYSLMLRYFLWMAKLSPGVQWGIILGGYFGNRILSSVARDNAGLAPWLLPFRILYLVFVLLTWTADPLFNLLLRLNRFGRMVLSREQIVASNWIGGCLFLALACLGLSAFVSFDGPFLIAAVVFGALIIPLAGTFNCPSGWPRRVMAGYTTLMAATGIFCALLLVFATTQSPEISKKWISSAVSVGMVFLIGALGSGWVANLLMMQRPRK